MSARRILVGPLPAWSCGVGVAWLVAAAVGVTFGGALWGWWPVVIGALGGPMLIAMGLRMTVLVDELTIRLPGGTPIPRDEVTAVGVRRLPGPLPIHVPVLEHRVGRALEWIDLDGLSGLGRAGGAQRRAARLAGLLDRYLVSLSPTDSGPARRAR